MDKLKGGRLFENRALEYKGNAIAFCLTGSLSIALFWIRLCFQILGKFALICGNILRFEKNNAENKSNRPSRYAKVGRFITAPHSRSIGNSKKLKRVSSTDLMGFPNMPSHPQESAALFNRLPRRRTALEPSTIEIKAPPVSLNSNDIPMLLRMGGPMVMSGAFVLAGHFTMMISSVLFPVLTQRYTEKQRKEYEIRRNSRYKAYGVSQEVGR